MLQKIFPKNQSRLFFGVARRSISGRHYHRGEDPHNPNFKDAAEHMDYFSKEWKKSGEEDHIDRAFYQSDQRTTWRTFIYIGLGIMTFIHISFKLSEVNKRPSRVENLKKFKNEDIIIEDLERQLAKEKTLLAQAQNFGQETGPKIVTEQKND
jgi:hypothetical protein